jgi:hypothetical protein
MADDAAADEGQPIVVALDPDKCQVPATIDYLEARRSLAKYAAYVNLGLSGQDINAKTFVLMSIAQSRGLDPIEAKLQFDVIEGKPTMTAEAMRASFIASGGLIEYIEHSATAVRMRFTHPKYAPNGYERECRIEDFSEFVEKKKNWRQYPENMLQARCSSFAIKAIAPELTLGLYTPEEVRDISK